jgi:hypothetical protein
MGHCQDHWVARLRQHIELECAAMQQALTGFALTAQHEIIQRKYETLGYYHEQLEQLVGEKEAAIITTEIYVKVIG